MKTRNFEIINHQIPREYKNKKEQYNCIAWDTETSEGACGLIANSIGKYLVSHNIDEILSFISNEEYKEYLNVFYNLGYDMNAIIKLLPLENLMELSKTNKTIYNDYTISIIPSKSFKINKNKFFDVWQFFKYEDSSKLDNVSEKYLKEKKIDVEAITGIKKENYQFTDFENKELINYCIKDCVLTQRLTDMIISCSSKLDMLFNTPYSCATLSKQYFFSTRGLKNPYWFYFNPKFGNKKAFEIAFKSYYGGRFEVFKKGYFENVYEYDVNSMYPAQMQKLHDIFNYEFIKVPNEKSFDRLRNKNTFYAFINIEVTQDMGINILPYIDEQGVLIYPKGTFHTTITYPELELLEKYEQEYKIIDGVIGEPKNKVTLPFQPIIQDIFNERKKYDKKDFISSYLKIIMNSMYGSFIELNIELKKSKNKDIMNMLPDDFSEEILTKNYKAGKYFCPIYASYITSLARCYLTESMLKSNYDSIISCFTDSVISTEPLEHIKINKDIGSWDKAKYDYGVFVGTGLYALENIEEKKYKVRTRGFKFMGIDEFDFEQFLKGEYQTTKTMKLKESIIQHNITDFNKILKTDRDINLNFDNKRIWQDKFNSVDDVYNKQITSSPIQL